MVTGLSKGVATLCTYPLIRAKVLQQTSRVAGSKPFMVIIREVLAAEGVRGLYQGVLAISYKTVLWNSLMMFFKHLLSPHRPITPQLTPGLGSVCGTPPLSPSDSPATPDAISRGPLPLFQRDVFPVENAADKLDEILRYLKSDGGGNKREKRMVSLESRLDSVTDDIGEVKRLLQHLLVTSAAQNGGVVSSSAGDDGHGDDGRSVVSRGEASTTGIPGSGKPPVERRRVGFSSLLGHESSAR